MSDYIHRFVPGVSAEAPTILTLHGTGGDENDLLPLARMVSPDAAVLSLRGNVLENGMPRFFRRLSEGVFDLEDLRVRTAELGQFIDAAAARYRFDRSRVVALGYSNGANIAASLMFSQQNALRGAILLRAMVPFEPESPPSLQGVSVLVSAGRQDPMIPQKSTDRLAALLRQAGADVTLSWYDAGHGLVPREMERATRWFGERMA